MSAIGLKELNGLLALALDEFRSWRKDGCDGSLAPTLSYVEGILIAMQGTKWPASLVPGCVLISSTCEKAGVKLDEAAPSFGKLCDKLQARLTS